MDPELEVAVRTAAFAALRQLVAHHGTDLSWEVIEPGFRFGDERILFANRARGIFKPRQLDVALSIKTTVPRQGRSRRYEDLLDDDEFIYRYQGDRADHADNVALKRARELNLPLIYLYGLSPGVYRPLWPAYVVEVDDRTLSCKVAFSHEEPVTAPALQVADPNVRMIERRYATVEVKRRLHQDAFRHHVLRAYDERCSICRMPRRELLDAAHIVPDRDVRGVPEIPNGLALCRLHHGAFDADLLGIHPGGAIVISPRLLAERDGPTLEHGLKGFDGKQLHLPGRREHRPRPEFLEERFARFRRAG